MGAGKVTLMYKVKEFDRLDDKWVYVRFSTAPNKGHIIHFPTRQKAAQYIRNHREIGQALIIHPDGTKEKFPS